MLTVILIAALILLVISCLFSKIELAILGAVIFLAALFLRKKIEHYVSFKDEKASELHARLTSVFPESAAVKVSGSNESFTIDKKHIYLCLKDQKGQYYDDNTLMHVLLHEYAHVLCSKLDTEGEHSDEFKEIFADLLRRATEAGIYDPTKPIAENYCGY
jgi:uncharacterized membrane protein YhiD involved in acid resistance